MKNEKMDSLLELEKIVSHKSKSEGNHLDLIEVRIEKNLFPELHLYHSDAKTIIRYLGNGGTSSDFFFIVRKGNDITERVARESLRELKERYRKRGRKIIADSYFE